MIITASKKSSNSKRKHRVSFFGCFSSFVFFCGGGGGVVGFRARARGLQVRRRLLELALSAGKWLKKS